MSKQPGRATRLALVPLLAILASATVAHAEVSSDCGPWTWLPDFRCEERTARPPGTFNPVGMPFLFEDPHITTGANFVYVYHRFPEGGTGLEPGVVFDGGGIHVLALQLRLALTDNLAFIATKDGASFMRPGSDALLPDTDGVFDLTIGFKYKLWESEEWDFIVSPALRYEIPLGSVKLFQGLGDGVIIPSASFRWGLGKLGLERANLIGSIGGQVALDSNANVNSMFYNLHFDYGIPIEGSFVKFIVPFIELNGQYYTTNGNGQTPVYLKNGPRITAPLPFEGVDVANLGSPVIDGESVVTVGGGFRLPTTWGVSFAAMYEGPVSGRDDIHNGRFTFMATWEM